MKWVKENWQWAALNLFALAVMADLLWQSATLGGFDRYNDPILVNSGKWAVRFLLLCLAMTPLNTLFGWRSAIKLRKPAGLWAFGFAAVHFVWNVAGALEDWLRYPIPDYVAGLGVIALSILALMASTSTRWAMKHMGKWWKRLHRLVYAAGMIALLHALLEAPSKRVFLYDPAAELEIRLYLVLLIVLLIVRIPAIRSVVAGLRHGLRNENKSDAMNRSV
jgi:methionine sulfoxide reductase heme-binding subunit